jgi:hypothetical protein
VWIFIGGRGSNGLPATWKAEWLLTIVRSNSQPASTCLPSSRTSNRIVAANGMIHPVVRVSRNGVQRFTVSPSLVAEG